MKIEDVLDKLQDLHCQLFQAGADSYFLSKKEKLLIIKQIRLHEGILDDLTIVDRFNAELERSLI